MIAKHCSKLAAGLAAIVCSTLTMAGCATPSTPPEADAAGGLPTGFVNVGEDAAKPRMGGTLRISESYPLQSLDPTVQTGASTGGLEAAAVFDQLIRYNADSDTFEPKLAESLVPNSDFTVWTLHLRAGVKFTDGTPLDAAAVVFNLQRYASTPSAVQSALVRMIAEFDTPNVQTVVMTLDRPWTRFPGLLAGNPGMIGSPAAIKSDPKAFSLEPVGAGAFRVTSFVPGEKMLMSRNDAYWNGLPNLEGIDITFNTDPLAGVDRLASSEVDFAKFTGDKPTAEALSKGFPGYIWAGNGWGYLLNHDPASKSPTADVRVRQAMAAAISPDQLRSRISKGAGLYHSSLFGENSLWSTEATGTAYNPDLARALVDEVKAETGWDGALVLTATGDPAPALAVQAMLNAVGFDLVVDTVPTFSDIVSNVFAKRDFQMAQFGLGVFDDDPWASLFPNLHSAASGNASKYSNPEFDSALSEFGSAATLEQAQAAAEGIQTVFANDVPMLITGGNTYAMFWTDRLHGVVPTSRSVMLLDQAYLAE